MPDHPYPITEFEATLAALFVSVNRKDSESIVRLFNAISSEFHEESTRFGELLRTVLDQIEAATGGAQDA